MRISDSLRTGQAIGSGNTWRWCEGLTCARFYHRDLIGSVVFPRVKHVETALLTGPRFQPHMPRQLVQHFHHLIEPVQALLVAQGGARGNPLADADHRGSEVFAFTGTHAESVDMQGLGELR